eukprot:1158038-Pelagomonas_calceolata.AAC.1
MGSFGAGCSEATQNKKARNNLHPVDALVSEISVVCQLRWSGCVQSECEPKISTYQSQLRSK